MPFPSCSQLWINEGVTQTLCFESPYTCRCPPDSRDYFQVQCIIFNQQFQNSLLTLLFSKLEILYLCNLLKEEPSCRALATEALNIVCVLTVHQQGRSRQVSSQNDQRIFNHLHIPLFQEHVFVFYHIRIEATHLQISDKPLERKSVLACSIPRTSTLRATKSIIT